MSEELENSGNLARTDGIPALKEWPEISAALLPNLEERRDCRVMFITLVVSPLPDKNRKTGRFKKFKDFSDAIFLRSNKEATGQTP